MSQKVNRVITILFLIVVVIAVMIFFNGTAIHTVSEQNIESDFLQNLYQKGFEEGEIVDKYVYNNSETLFFKNQKGQNVVAVYIKSLYSSQWKEYSVLQFEQGENVSIFVDDHIFQYRINYQQNEISIGEQKPLLAIRLFSIGVIVTAAAIGRMIGIHRERKKVDILGKK